MKQVSSNFYKNQEWIENNAFKTNEGEKTLEQRIEEVIPKIENILNAATIVEMAKHLIKEGYNSNHLKSIDNAELEKLCDPSDPATVIALIQYFEVNKKELEKLN